MNIKTLFSAFFLIAISCAVVNGQQKTDRGFIEGEVMVQLSSPSDLVTLENRFQQYDLKTVHTISARFNIFLLRFDMGKTKNSNVIKALRLEKFVTNVQNNHYVELRNTNDTLPDDTFIDEQWPLKNTGQAGGQPDADIDADEAWEITTGGHTAHGDQIVVAIIDGGSDLNHEDMNFWKNIHDIPNNGNDDDENGYVDDYDGWNAYNHTGEIPQHNHGVHVGGIAGATGNNGIGVSGVNWNVQVLPIAGSSSSSESIVVEALSYVYTVRERYDQTNGQEGAFIVADNCSFGVDNGNPDQFPIWEAMYDSLGQLGILSMGATANAAWDIDDVGDVPTAFETDFMVAVTNTTKMDQLYFSAGYGDTAIDLGAPGTIVKSCRVNNGYGNSTGTSMATPHVTGAAALILSAADSTCISNYKTSPDEGALLVKDFIMDGVDILSSLEGKTVTGGRLNVFNSINLMLNAPLLNVDRDSVFIILGVIDTGKDSLLLMNSGIEDLNYTVSVIEPCEWIDLENNTGTLSQSEEGYVVLNFDTDGLDTGTYTCRLEINGNRIFSQPIYVEMVVDSNVGTPENILLKGSVNVFPNPFANRATFKFEVLERGNALLDIFNQTGKLVYSKQQNVSAGKHQFNWENQQAASGIYFYKLSLNGQQLKTGKLVKK